jgi:Flp pilus assembly protein TadG
MEPAFDAVEPREDPMQLAHHRRTGAFRGSARDRSLGAVLVEAAFVTPVFMMMVLGIMEMGLAMNDKLAIAHTVRAGTRVASASGNDSYADYGIIQAVRREAAALPDTSIIRVVVYRASRFGEAPPQACMDGTSLTPANATAPACNVYVPSQFDDVKSRWACNVAESLDKYWCPTSRITSRSVGPNYVGVWMKVEHHWITQLFGDTAILTDQSVIRLEPRTK